MVPSRADPWEPLSIPSRSPPVPGSSFRPSVFLLFITALLASQVGLCAADSSDDDQGSVTWVFPKGGEVFRYRDIVNVSYQTSYSQPWLYVWCTKNQTTNSVRFIRKQQVEPHDASVLISMDFSASTPCWFNLRDNTKSDKGLNSEKWSLKKAERQSGPITTGAPVPSTTVTTSTTTSPTSSSNSAASTTAAANASSSDGISVGAKAGLGIGVGIGTSLLCAGVFWLYYRHVKRKEHHQEVYRRIMGGQGGGAGPAQNAYATPNNIEHLEPWRYGGTPQPAPSAVGSAWSGVSSDQSTEWYPGQTTASTPYQYYDPVGSSHQVGAGTAAATVAYQHPPPSVITTASMAAEPPPSIVGGPSGSPSGSNLPRPDHVPDAAAIRDVQDLSSSLYPSAYNEPVSPVSADQRSIPPTRVASVNYGPNGPRDASTGADFTLLPDYTSPMGGGGEYQRDETDEDIYGPPTPRSPPPPHSAHANISTTSGLSQPQQQHAASQQYIVQGQAWQPASTSNNVVELPTAQTHHRGYGPQAELPADGVRVQPSLRQQRSDLRGPEQKVLLHDIATPRPGQQHRDGG